MRRYQREWLAKRRAAWFADKECVDCGSTEQLELDHVDPATKVSHSIWSWSEVKRNTEAAKCEVRCHDCHWDRTVREGLLVHGTQHPNAKLNEKKVRIIKMLLGWGVIPQHIADLYEVDRSAIREIHRGNTWKHV